MVSDQEIAKGVETVLRQSDPNAVTSLNGVVQQLEAKLGLDLSHKAGFIRDQINNLLRSHPQSQPHPPPKDHFAPQHHPQFHPQHFHPHFALQPPPQHQHRPEDLNFRSPPQLPPQSQLQPQPSAQVQSPPAVKPRTNSQNAAANASEAPKESAKGGTKRRGGPGGLNKVCGVSPELQAIVGEPALARTEIVKQLWAYIRKNNLQDPNNKRKIICDDPLRLVFETDSTDMFKMNKLLAKHIIPLEPSKESSHAKKSKINVESTNEGAESVQFPVIISEPLAKFFGTGEREMDPTKALNRVWEYVRANHLEDPVNSMVIQCDAKLRELLGCESITGLGVRELLFRHHLYKR